MKVLIADDNEQKQNILKKCIIDAFSGVEIEQTYSFMATIKKLTSSKSFDVILLDMTMPNYDTKETMSYDGKMRTLAGHDIVTKMAYKKIVIPTIIVTQFEVFGRHSNLKAIAEIVQELIEMFPNIVKDYVLFDPQSEFWKKDLVEKIEKLNL